MNMLKTMLYVLLIWSLAIAQAFAAGLETLGDPKPVSPRSIKTQKQVRAVVGYRLDGSPIFGAVRQASPPNSKVATLNISSIDRSARALAVLAEYRMMTPDLIRLRERLAQSESETGEIVVFGQTQRQSREASGVESMQIENSDACSSGYRGENDHENRNNRWCHAGISKVVAGMSEPAQRMRLTEWGVRADVARCVARYTSRIIGGLQGLGTEVVKDKNITAGDVVITEVPLTCNEDLNVYATVWGDGDVIVSWSIKF